MASIAITVFVTTIGIIIVIVIVIVIAIVIVIVGGVIVIIVGRMIYGNFFIVCHYRFRHQYIPLSFWSSPPFFLSLSLSFLSSMRQALFDYYANSFDESLKGLDYSSPEALREVLGGMKVIVFRFFSETQEDSSQLRDREFPRS